MDDYPRGGLRSLAKGATFGWSDELTSAIAATLASARGSKWKDAYEDILKTERGEQARFERENPATAFGLDLAGGLGTGMPLAKAAAALAPVARAGMSTAKRFGRWAATSPVAQGAAQGAVGGAGAADEGRGSGAGVGAVVGAAVGKGGDLLLRGGKKLFEVLGFRNIDKAVADDLLEAMRKDGLDPKAILEKVAAVGRRTQKPVTLADVVAEIEPGEHTRKALDAALARSSGHRKKVEEFLEARVAGQKNEVVGDVGDALNQLPRPIRETVQGLIDRRKKSTTDLYKEAFSNKTRLNAPELQSLHQSGAMDDALKAVREELRIKGKELPVRWATAAELPGIPKALLTGEEAVRGRTPYYSPTLEQYHGMKQHLWDLADKAKVQNPLGSPKATKVSMAYDDARRDLQKLLMGDDATVGIGGPVYKQAEALFGGESKLIEAAQKGARLFKTDPTEIRTLVSKMDDPEKEAFLSGFGGFVEGLPATESGDFARKLTGDSEKLKRLEAMLSHIPGAYENLVDRLRTSGQLQRAASAYPAATRDPSFHGALWAAARAARGDPKGGAVDYAKHWFEYPHPKYAERATEFGWGRPGAQDFSNIESRVKGGLPNVQFGGAPAAAGGVGGLSALPSVDPYTMEGLGETLGSLPQ